MYLTPERIIMFEKFFGKKKSIQREMMIGILVIVILVTIFSSVGFYIFVHQEIAKIVTIDIQNNEELEGLISVIRRGIIIILINTVIISSAIIQLASKKILGPLEKMMDATKKVAEGDFEVRLETQRKDEIQDLTNNFNHMVKELGETELLQKDFIDNVSHEIKTPINSIQGFAKLLDDVNLSQEERKEYVDIIVEESNRILDLSSNILKLSKLQHQDKITKKEQVDIAEQLRKAVVLLEPKWKEKQIEILVNLQQYYFAGDEELLLQVWTNLLDNAIKFSHPKGRIVIATAKKEDHLMIQMQDNGIGMKPEELEKIYTRFYQVDQSHSGEGSGLGLAIVKRIVELSKGTIQFTSKEGEGTTVTITLPLIEKQNKIWIR